MEGMLSLAKLIIIECDAITIAIRVVMPMNSREECREVLAPMSSLGLKQPSGMPDACAALMSLLGMGRQGVAQYVWN